MKYYLISLNGYGEIIKKRFNGRSLFSYARKDNFDILAPSGRWGYIYLGKALERGYYNLFDEAKNFPGEAFIRGWKDIKTDGKTFFLCRFMAQSEGVIIEENVNLSDKEKVELLNILSDGGKKFRFFLRNSLPILIFQKDFPEEEILFPDNMQGKDFNLYLYRRQELEDVKNLIISSTSILENHPVNRVRQDLGEMQANLMWLWGIGKPKQPSETIASFNKELFYFSLEDRDIPLSEFFGFKKADSIKDIPDGAFIWINSAIDRKSNYSVWLRKFEKLDKEILNYVVEEYKKGEARVLFTFDGFISPDIEIKNCWVPFLYISENLSTIRFRKRFKEGLFLLKLLLE